MSALSTDEIREIAESIGLDDVFIHNGKVLYPCGIREDYPQFNPDTDWRDTGLVLEALVKHQSQFIGGRIELDGDTDEFFCSAYSSVLLANCGEGATLNEAICRAYLSMIRE